MTTWIFLRGLTRESRHWGHFIEQFQHALPGCQLIALDLPGNGQLNQERSPVRVQDMVTHCRA
ncbi:MAG: alpha/beta hydrolase, partial [Aquabacterium sp.]|nr:alpha/beta hydrolase [Aquabacterium sp.]